MEAESSQSDTEIKKEEILELNFTHEHHNIAKELLQNWFPDGVESLQPILPISYSKRYVRLKDTEGIIRKKKTTLEHCFINKVVIKVTWNNNCYYLYFYKDTNSLLLTSIMIKWIQYLDKKGIRVYKPILSHAGNNIEKIDLGGNRYYAWLTKEIPGKMIDTLLAATPSLSRESSVPITDVRLYSDLAKLNKEISDNSFYIIKDSVTKVTDASQIIFMNYETAIQTDKPIYRLNNLDFALNSIIHQNKITLIDFDECFSSRNFISHYYTLAIYPARKTYNYAKYLLGEKIVKLLHDKTIFKRAHILLIILMISFPGKNYTRIIKAYLMSYINNNLNEKYKLYYQLTGSLEEYVRFRISGGKESTLKKWQSYAIKIITLKWNKSLKKNLDIKL